MGLDTAMQATIGTQNAAERGSKSGAGTTNNGRPIVGLLKVLTASAALGTLGPVAAVAYGEGLAPATLSALRAGLGAGLLGALLLARSQPSVAIGRLPRRQQVLLAVAVAANGLMNLALFFAFGAMAVGLVMLIFYCYPVLVAVLSAALGRDPLTRQRILALGVAAAGVALVLGGQLDPAAHLTAAGVALAGAAAALHAAYLVTIRDGFDDVPTVQATSLVLAGGLVISGAAAMLVEWPGALGGWLASPVAWVAVLLAGTLGALPKVWIISGVRLVGSTKAAIAMLMEPVVAVTVAAAALGQRLTGLELAGGAAILAAVVLVQAQLRPGRRGGPPAPGQTARVSSSAAPGPAAPGPGSPPGGRDTT